MATPSEETYLAGFKFEPVHTMNRDNFQKGRSALTEAEKVTKGYYIQILQFADGGRLYRLAPYNGGYINQTQFYAEHVAALLTVLPTFFDAN